jgi:hypothetical protein
MPHALRAALLVCLLLPGPAAAFTFSFSGFVESADNAGFLDSSVHAASPGIEATAVTVNYVVDPSTADVSSPFDVGTAHLTIQFGSYTFDSGPVSGTIAHLDDAGVPGSTLDIWQSNLFSVSDLSPATTPSGSFGGYSAQLQFFDFDSAVFDGSESEPIDPTAPAFSSAWDLVRIEFFSLDGSQNQTTSVHLQMVPVPEPRALALVALGLVSLAVRARQVSRSEPEASEAHQAGARMR